MIKHPCTDHVHDQSRQDRSRQAASSYSLRELIAYLDQGADSAHQPLIQATIRDPQYLDHRITHLASLQSATPSALSFVFDRSVKDQVQHTQAGALLVATKVQSWITHPAIVCQEARLAFVRLMQLFARDQQEQQAACGHSSRIAASAVIADDAQLADRVRIDAHAVIGSGCVIGAGTHIHAHVTLYPETVIGVHCIVHAGTVIGADGFGFHKQDTQWLKIPQLGRVVIGDHVEIGANSTIDRGTLDDTEIDAGVKIDNQVHIAHNVKIGKNSLICGCVGIAGSATIGTSCILAGGVGISDHVRIADGVTITAGSPIIQSIEQPGSSYSAAPPTMPTARWRRYIALLKTLADRLSSIQQRLTRLESGRSSTSSST